MSFSPSPVYELEDHDVVEEETIDEGSVCVQCGVSVMDGHEFCEACYPLLYCDECDRILYRDGSCDCTQ